jgi:hypothetical protein
MSNGRSVVVDMKPGSAEAIERPWWRTCHPFEFRRRAESMSRVELECLGSDMAGALAGMQGTIQTSADESRVRQARAALGYTAEKRGILKSILHARNESERQGRLAQKAGHVANEGKRSGRLERAQELLDAGDTAGALRLVLETLKR